MQETHHTSPLCLCPLGDQKASVRGGFPWVHLAIFLFLSFLSFGFWLLFLKPNFTNRSKREIHQV